MTANPSIDRAPLLAEHLERAEPDLLRALLKTFAEALTGADADAVCGAPFGAPPARRGSRPATCQPVDFLIGREPPASPRTAPAREVGAPRRDRLRGRPPGQFRREGQSHGGWQRARQGLVGKYNGNRENSAESAVPEDRSATLPRLTPRRAAEYPFLDNECQKCSRRDADGDRRDRAEGDGCGGREGDCRRSPEGQDSEVGAHKALCGGQGPHRCGDNVDHSPGGKHLHGGRPHRARTGQRRPRR